VTLIKKTNWIKNRDSRFHLQWKIECSVSVMLSIYTYRKVVWKTFKFFTKIMEWFPVNLVIKCLTRKLEVQTNPLVRSLVGSPMSQISALVTFTFIVIGAFSSSTSDWRLGL